MGNIVNAIVNGLLTALSAFFSLFTTPISILLSSFFPDLNDTLASALNSVYEVIDEIVYPATILPHSFITSLDIALALLISYVGIVVSYYVATWAIRTIQHLNPFSSGGGKV